MAPNKTSPVGAETVSPSETASGLSIRYRSIRDLRPDARNARKHTIRQITKLRASLAHYGWTNPILVAQDGVIAGHARLAAALAMAEEGQAIAGNADPWQAPTVDLSHLPPADRRAYMLADNRLALDAGWDADLLRIELAELQNSGGFDLTLTGFGKIEIDTLLGTVHTAGRGLSDDLRYQIVVECRDEDHQARELETLRARGLTCRPLIL